MLIPTPCCGCLPLHRTSKSGVWHKKQALKILDPIGHRVKPFACMVFDVGYLFGDIFFLSSLSRFVR